MPIMLPALSGCWGFSSKPNRCHLSSQGLQLQLQEATINKDTPTSDRDQVHENNKEAEWGDSDTQMTVQVKKGDIIIKGLGNFHCYGNTELDSEFDDWPLTAFKPYVSHFSSSPSTGPPVSKPRALLPVTPGTSSNHTLGTLTSPTPSPQDNQSHLPLPPLKPFSHQPDCLPCVPRAPLHVSNTFLMLS